MVFCRNRKRCLKMSPKVSICIITYNHASFIAQTIESVLCQNVNFDFEIVIGDDDSTDDTRSILERYRRNHPNIIKIMPKSKNVGATRNFAKTLLSCSGKYVALLDGDDYWTCTNKLQKQFDFLEAHQDYSSCFHATQLVDRGGVNQTILPIEKYKKCSYDREDLIKYFAFMATSSVMFRNKYEDPLPSIFFTSEMMSDWTIHMLNAETGKIGYIDHLMAVYRSNSSIEAFTAKRMREIMIEEIKLNMAFNEYLNLKYDAIFKKRISMCYYKISIDYFRDGSLANSVKAMSQSMRCKFSIALLCKGLLLEGPYVFIKNCVKNSLRKK